jgi:hypothetical protein
MKLAHAVVVCTLFTGCTQWTRTESARPSREIGRLLVGEPHLEESTTSEAAVDYAEVAGRDGEERYAVGAATGERRTVRRTRCVQKAMIDLEQDVELRPQVTNRRYDVLAAVGLALLGGIIAGSAHEDYTWERDNYESDLRFHERDPDFFPMPTEPSRPVAYYATGAGLAVAGLAVVAYSFGRLPRGDRPKTELVRRRWTTETYVDATGCHM